MPSLKLHNSTVKDVVCAITACLGIQAHDFYRPPATAAIAAAGARGSAASNSKYSRQHGKEAAMNRLVTEVRKQLMAVLERVLQDTMGKAPVVMPGPRSSARAITVSGQQGHGITSTAISDEQQRPPSDRASVLPKERASAEIVKQNLPAAAAGTKTDSRMQRGEQQAQSAKAAAPAVANSKCCLVS